MFSALKIVLKNLVEVSVRVISLKLVYILTIVQNYYVLHIDNKVLCITDNPNINTKCVASSSAQ